MQNYSAPEVIRMQDQKAYAAQPVIVPMPDQKVNDDIIFSTFNLHFCNPCCLGFGAFYNSVKARDSRLLGDFTKARSYGARARRFNIAAIIIGSILILTLLILIIVCVKAYLAVSTYNKAVSTYNQAVSTNNQAVSNYDQAVSTYNQAASAYDLFSALFN